ncbi:Phage protein (ACLAME 496) [hydrothermal vent metagenome]|uniref:Phage protein (ACLAME 496) n=1 Tax=hydrothermal vent metagenome TaxID=652676 RepID=A0A3B1BN80_9ZZZZ
MGKDKSKIAGAMARAAALSPEERTEIAKNAAKKRWGVPQSEYTGELTIGEMSFPCSVLSDGTRILTQSDFMAGMGMYYSGWVAQNKPKNTSSAGIPHFLAFKSLMPHVNKHLGDMQSITLKYRTERGSIAHGIRAEIIPKICDVWLDAEESSNLGSRQKKIAQKAKLLMRALAHVGIIALVDEATGFQRDRAANALAEILEKYIAKELQPWVKTFPDDYYEELFRLRGLEFPNATVKKPQYFGHLTNDIIYKRLAPAVLDELRKTTPKDGKGRRRHKFFQQLTPELGNPKLREHMASVVTIMRLSDDYNDFREKLEKIHPPYNQTMPLPFEDESSSGL